jgi:electron transport complex protein RnfD
MENVLKVGAAPHIVTKHDTRSVMLDVVIALMPALLAGVYFFGYRAALIVLISIASAVAFEHIWNVALKKPTTIGDLSAVVSGILLAFNLPSTVPLWLPVAGSFFMIVIIKMAYGGLGHNFMNPALGARAFLLASWPIYMTSFTKPQAKLFPVLSPDFVTQATPLGILKEQSGEALPTYLDMFLGNLAGCIGETSKIALLIGFIYLLARGVISWKIPVAFAGTVAALAWVFGGDTLFTGDWLMHLLTGGVFLGAIFMATDYTTTPITESGMIIFGIGCGLLTMIIRLVGGYPEGGSYSILIMNVLTPLLDKYIIPKPFGKAAKKIA